ncbi:MAG: hypothetical protein AB7Q42_21770 [Acidimicrobiia bacterium]
MTLTDTVTHLAHEASEAAHDLRKTATDLGRSAAESGSDVAAAAASTAGNLARAVAEKLPGVTPPPRKSHWMRWAVLAVVAITVAAAVKLRRRPTIDPTILPAEPTGPESANSKVQPARIAAS